MRDDQTTRSLVLGAFAAAVTLSIGSFLTAATASPGPNAYDAIWLGLIAMHAARLMPGRGVGRRRRGVAAATAVLAAGVAAWVAGLSSLGVLAAGAAALGVSQCATRVTRRQAPLRRMGVEVGLFVGSISAAVWLAHVFGHGVIGAAVGIWGFFLVQGLRGVRGGGWMARDLRGDRFEHACREIEALLQTDEMATHGR